jgi:hypothetical protein
MCILLLTMALWVGLQTYQICAIIFKLYLTYNYHLFYIIMLDDNMFSFVMVD